MRTRADAVYRRIRDDILRGRLRPGQRLPFAETCTAYDVSTGVLREVLPRLAEQGLVVAEPQVGFHVVEVSAADLTNLTEARVAVESLVLRQSIAAGDVAWESAALASHHTLTRTAMLDPDGQVAEAWRTAHAAFHAVVLSACPNPRLRDIAAGLRDVGEVYRSWSQGASVDVAGGRDVAEEHRRLLDAVLARDPDAAAAALEDHISRTTAVLLALTDAVDHLTEIRSDL